MRPWKDHENVPEIGAKIIWRSLEIEQVLSLTLLPRPHNTFELQHTKEEVATKIERQSGAQRGPPPPRRVQEQVRNTRLTVPAIFRATNAPRHRRAALSQDMSHPERNGAQIADSLMDAEISGEEGIRVYWAFDPMTFARWNLHLRLRQVNCFVCTIVQSVFAFVAKSPTPHLDVFSMYRLIHKPIRD